MRVVQALIDSPYPYRYERSYGLSGSSTEAVFTAANGDEVVVSMTGGGYVSFTRGQTHDFTLTGGGDAYRILATVIAVLKDWVKREHPNFFFFTADKHERSRIRVYDILAQRLNGTEGYEAASVLCSGRSPDGDPIFETTPPNVRLPPDILAIFAGMSTKVYFFQR